jgi:hypothetical protein
LASRSRASSKSSPSELPKRVPLICNDRFQGATPSITSTRSGNHRAKSGHASKLVAMEKKIAPRSSTTHVSISMSWARIRNAEFTLLSLQRVGAAYRPFPSTLTRSAPRSIGAAAHAPATSPSQCLKHLTSARASRFPRCGAPLLSPAKESQPFQIGTLHA